MICPDILLSFFCNFKKYVLFFLINGRFFRNDFLCARKFTFDIDISEISISLYGTLAKEIYGCCIAFKMVAY